jgi:dolichyl-phosphate beta-glucosyltransferase
MLRAPDGILLVTPVWRDSARLEAFGSELAGALAGSSLPVTWIVADDGSGEHERDRLATLADGYRASFPHVHTHFADVHRGKGAVVREAWSLAPQARWFAFVDADGSIPAHDLLRLLKRAVEDGVSAIGIRQQTATTVLEQHPFRAVTHRLFLNLARVVLGLQSRDIQCGAKIIHGDDYRMIVSRLEECGLAFDSELLTTLARAGASWTEVPVNWREKGGGRVKPLRHAWSMITALMRMRRKLR